MKVYGLLKKGISAHIIFSLIWKSAPILRYKVFFWLLLKDRLNNRNLLQKKTFNLPDYSCVLCDDKVDETNLHLFLDCPSSLCCWRIICHNKNRGLYSQWLKKVFLPRRHYLKILQWTLLLWDLEISGIKEIEKSSIESDRPSVNSWKHLIKQDLQILSYRINTKFRDGLNSSLGWILSYPKPSNLGILVLC